MATGTRFPSGISGPILQDDGTQQAAIVSLTDNSGGTAADTIPAITGSYVEATMETIVASLAGKINEINAALQAAGITEAE